MTNADLMRELAVSAAVFHVPLCVKDREKRLGEIVLSQRGERREILKSLKSDDIAHARWPL